MVPKSKRAKRRNRRHGSSGYVLYGWFQFLETEKYWNNVIVRDWGDCVGWSLVRTVMVGGIVEHG